MERCRRSCVSSLKCSTTRCQGVWSISRHGPLQASTQKLRQHVPIDVLEGCGARAVVPAAQREDFVRQLSVAEFFDEDLGEIDRECQVVLRVDEQRAFIADALEILEWS